MRIAMLSTVNGYYGGEVHFLGLAEGLRSRGHEILCLVRRDGELQSRLLARDFEVHALPLFHWFDPIRIGHLNRLLRRRRIELLHTHLPRDYYIAAAATMGSKVANIGTRHQIFPISAPLFKRPFFRRFSAMIAVSEAVRSGLVGSRVLASSRVVTVHNGVTQGSDRSGVSEMAGPFRQACGAEADTPFIGFVGRLCPTKGLETLIQAAGLLVEDWPDLKLCVIGSEEGHADYLAYLQALVEELGLASTVRFLGYRHDAWAAAREFQVQVIASQAEPFGLVTLEAMAQECPVVVTDSGGSPEIVRDGVEGFLVRPGDVRQLSRRLDVLLDSASLCREMGRKGRLRVEKDFTLELMLDRTEAVYRRALERPAGRFRPSR
jgi:glycosyltransferase involved in cell wall biosynthesis|nr:glycosyltransferase family 4 protein [Candidatus Krumholzibacteria bacterium]